MTKYEFLITYAPPYVLQERIDKYLSAAAAAGKPDEVIENWLKRWRETLGHAESELINDLDEVTKNGKELAF